MQPSEAISSEPVHHFARLLSNCIRTNDLKLGRLIHSRLIKTALTFNTFLANRLIYMYSKCCSIEYAQQAFNELSDKNAQSWNTMLSAYSKKGFFEKTFQLLDVMPDPNVVSYNSIISSLTHHGFPRKAMGFFKRMQIQCGNEFLIDEFTVVGMVNTCAGLGALNLLHELHGLATVIGVRFNLVVCNALIDAYGKCGKPEYSYSIFCQMRETDVFSWTSLLVAYIRASRMADASSLFDHMPIRNVVAWTALITGFAQNGEGDKALCTFKEMLEEGIVPRASTYVSILSACADIPLVGKVNALVDMYCKCGDMISAMRLFERLDGKDRVTWNSIINGFAQNGNGVMSFFMFEKMIEADTTPNHVTFLGVLSACSHCGLLSEGFQYLHSMERKYGIVPELDHYAILIDLLGRKNMLGEAADLIKRAPWGRDNIGMWGALLGACRVHGNLKLARRAAEDLFELEPDNAARYIMLSNIYAAAGRWDDARSLRRYMDDRGLVKEAAYSWIEIKNIRHKFITKDKSHSRLEEIKELLLKLVDPMKDAGYIFQIECSYFLVADALS
nr:pentatricopeptide repeat-containing protein At2g13600-like isoform X2 [Nicotiana tomentosiformis]